MGFFFFVVQADVCHAYQLLRKGGLKEENIVVFMYDDIATHELNPRPGIIINHPQGDDVYAESLRYNPFIHLFTYLFYFVYLFIYFLNSCSGIFSSIKHNLLVWKPGSFFRLLIMAAMW